MKLYNVNSWWDWTMLIISVIIFLFLAIIFISIAIYELIKENNPKGLFLILFLILVLHYKSTKGQTPTPVEVWKGMGDFNQHRTVCTAIAWTGTIFGCKLTHDTQWKGALIGAGLALGVGGAKEVVWDGMMRKGVPSAKDFGGDCLGTAVGTMAGIMCNGLAQHMRDKREERRALQFHNPLD